MLLAKFLKSNILLIKPLLKNGLIQSKSSFIHLYLDKFGHRQ